MLFFRFQKKILFIIRLKSVSSISAIYYNQDLVYMRSWFLMYHT